MNTKMTAKELALYLLSRQARIRYPNFEIIMATVLSDKKGNFSWSVNSLLANGSCHAEEGALRRANRRRLAGSTLTVAGMRLRSGSLLHSRPCERRCLKLIKKLGVEKIEYLDATREWTVEPVNTVPHH